MFADTEMRSVHPFTRVVRVGGPTCAYCSCSAVAVRSWLRVRPSSARARGKSNRSYTDYRCGTCLFGLWLEATNQRAGFATVQLCGSGSMLLRPLAGSRTLFNLIDIIHFIVFDGSFGSGVWVASCGGCARRAAWRLRVPCG